MKPWCHLGIFILFLVIIPSILVGQAVLRGTVRDSLSEELLFGTNVHLQGTALGASSNIEGKFRIGAVPPGNYTVRFSYIGYKSKILPVKVTDKEIIIDAELMPDNILTQEVIITAQMRGQMAAINQQINSNTIVNVVSEERIQELPDVNAAEVIGRLAGVSLLRSGGEANKVILRGLSDKFSTITIDGIKIPPTDADARGVDLSTISQGSLAGVELFKALTADKDADAIAGSVNLVTKRAPEERLIRVDAKGDYNQLMNAYDQYDFSLRYGERFFENILGVQVTGNLERRNRSNERINLDYNQAINFGRDYEISNFVVEFTDEIRNRQGIGLLLDFNTPDSGSIRINNIYSNTDRDYLYSTRNYPFGTGQLISYAARDREQKINTINSSIQGNNFLAGFTINWGLSIAQSIADYPYDFALDFIEPSIIQNGQLVSGMRTPPSIKENPEQIVPYALNNFNLAYSNWGYYRGERNKDREQTLFLHITRPYQLVNTVAGEIMVGGKYKDKTREKISRQLLSPYYLGYYRDYSRMPDGSLQPKNLFGTRFNTFAERFKATNGSSRTPFASDFLDADPAYRNLYDKYSLKPIVNREALREWYALNKNGTDILGRNPEYYDDPSVATDYYDIIERVSAGFLMNTLNFGQNVTFIAGLRMEQEENDYTSKFSPTSLGGFPTMSGEIRDTTATHTETIWLPNFHLTLRPFDFVNVRVAAYRALSRPDFNMRLEKYVATGGGGALNLILGNAHLRTAKAWNYEVNTSFYGNTIGLISVSAFYKEIKDMYHLLSGANTSGSYLLDSLKVGWRSPFGASSYGLTVPYNSSEPTKVWGFEFEHQTNFSFFSGFLQNLILSYNFSIVRSQTHLISTSIETTYVQTVPGFPPFPVYSSKIVHSSQKLEGQPEFYGNIALGYDIGGFSARVSVFHQGEFNHSFSGNGLSDQVINRYTRWDLAIKQVVNQYLSIMLNVNNLTAIEERNSIINRQQGWKLLNTAEKYGMTVDVGVRLTL